MENIIRYGNSYLFLYTKISKNGIKGKDEKDNYWK